MAEVFTEEQLDCILDSINAVCLAKMPFKFKRYWDW